MTPQEAPTDRRRWWTPALVVHAVLVVAVMAPGTAHGAIESWGEGLLFATQLLLGSPWWLPFGLLGASVPSASALGHVIDAAPAVLNVALHAAALRLLPRRVLDGLVAGARGRWALSPSATFVVAVAAGALVWAAWLGRDRTASYDVITQQVESPYASLQVLGCAVSVGAVTGLLAHRWSPLASAAGVAAGFWIAWTADAKRPDGPLPRRSAGAGDGPGPRDGDGRGGRPRGAASPPDDDGALVSAP